MFLAMLQGAEPKEEAVDLGKGVKLEMVLIPAEKFMMGSTKDAAEESIKGNLFFKNIIKDKEEAEVSKIIETLVERERLHEVTISKPFYMGKYEVTQEQWQEVMGNKSSDKKSAKLPVTNVSWNDCQEFIKKLNAKTKGGYRLPTEAEWEYAARAGTKTDYSFGDTITPKDANYNNNFIGFKEIEDQYQQGKIKPVAVGSYKSNAFGLYDMHGNVAELCDDLYGEYPKGPVTDPIGPARGRDHVLRGGSFVLSAWDSRSANRVGTSPDKRVVDYGFRLARTAMLQGTEPKEENVVRGLGEWRVPVLRPDRLFNDLGVEVSQYNPKWTRLGHGNALYAIICTVNKLKATWPDNKFPSGTTHVLLEQWSDNRPFHTKWIKVTDIPNEVTPETLAVYKGNGTKNGLESLSALTLNPVMNVKYTGPIKGVQINFTNWCYPEAYKGNPSLCIPANQVYNSFVIKLDGPVPIGGK